MKLEQKIIDKVLHYRWYEDESFKPYTEEELTAIIEKERENYMELFFKNPDLEVGKTISIKDISLIHDVLQDQFKDSINLHQYEIHGALMALSKSRELILSKIK